MMRKILLTLGFVAAVGACDFERCDGEDEGSVEVGDKEVIDTDKND